MINGGFLAACALPAVAAVIAPGDFDCTPEDGFVSGCPPEVASGRLVANFVADAETLILDGTDVLGWRAANNPALTLVGGGAPVNNITFDADGLGGHGVLVVNDRSGENRHLRGSLGGELLTNATIFWVGHFAPGRAGSLDDGSGQYIYTFGRSGAAGSQFDNQIDDGRFEVYGGAGSQAGRDITYLHGADSVWMTRYHAAPTEVGHVAEANGIDLYLPLDASGYAAGGTGPGEDDLLLFGWQDSAGTAAGYNFVGDLHQLLVYDGTLDENDTVAVTNYLRSKLEEEPPPPGDDQSLVTRVVELTGVNAPGDGVPDLFFPHGDPTLSGEATFLLNPNNNTMDFEITLDDDRYIVTQAHMYSDHYKPNGDSIFCWGGRWSHNAFLWGSGYSVHGSYLQEMIDDPGRWTLVVHTEGGHFALDADGQLIPYDASAHETSVSGQLETDGRYNNRVPRRLTDRLLREQNPHSGHFGDATFDSVYPDREHFLREHDVPFPDAEGRQWIEFDQGSASWVPAEHGAANGLTIEAIEDTEYLFYRYDDQGPYWDYGGPEGAAGGVLMVPMDCPGDLNGDGLVDGADLMTLLGVWGASGTPADIDGSGLVDGADLMTLLGYWGPCA